MTRAGLKHRVSSRAACAGAMGLLAMALPASAQDWHDAYRSGVTALARGNPAQAATALRRAIALRPEPGRNVPTYGTNVEPRYFPYLRLAEAHLALGEWDAAREALDRSANWGAREPADERQKLLARLEAETVKQRPPPTPAPEPTAVVPVASPTPAPVAAAPAETALPSVPAAPLATPSPLATARPTEPPAPRLKPATAPHLESPSPGVHPSSPLPAPEAARATVEMFSEPAGASAYIDDESVGVTDPKTGRLVKTGVTPGRHRVRLVHAGYEDALGEIEAVAGGSHAFRATLIRSPARSTNARAGAFALLAVALIGLLAWIALRRPEGPSAPVGPTPALAASDTPTHANPGARSDALGQQWFGDFRLIEMLGRGGMASVFKAERRGELCALKRPLANLLDDAQFRERFLREAEIGRALNHPNIVRILERGAVEAVPYFAMELLNGQTVQALLTDRGASSPRPAAALVVQVAEALDYAHSKGVVHRDLKPANVMLLPDGTAKVMDFGIARARRFEGLTATAAFVGTPNYVAPEMIEGRGAEARSDLYALGLLFFELLTGRMPFHGETPYAILKKHCTEEPPLPSMLKRDVPSELDAIVMALLRKEPSDRPESAEAVVVALRDWLNRRA